MEELKINSPNREDIGQFINTYKKCANCGAELTEGQKFCPKCGIEIRFSVGDSVAPEINQFSQGVTKKHKTKKKLLIFVATALIIIIAAISAVFVKSRIRGKKIDFSKIYIEYCKEPWASLGTDGSYLSVDTNPYNKDNTIDYPEAYAATKDINKDLGLPDSLYYAFAHTTANDGMQSENYPDKGVTVQWKFHPNRGLEVIYKKYKR